MLVKWITHTLFFLSRARSVQCCTVPVCHKIKCNSSPPKKYVPHEHAGFCRGKLLRNKKLCQVKSQVKSHDGWTVGNVWKKEKGESIKEAKDLGELWKRQ